MIYDFAAVCFPEDENLADRTYWYLCDFSVKTGEAVIAPVGPHNRLQFARVVRTLSASGEAAPYDLRLIKRIAAKYGARRIPLPSAGNCRELGGVRYDQKHFTRYGVFVRCGSPLQEEDCAALYDYGVRAAVDLGGVFPECASFPFHRYVCLSEGSAAGTSPGGDVFSALEILAEETGCVLFGGKAEDGGADALSALVLLLTGATEGTASAEYRFPFEDGAQEERKRRRQELFSAIKLCGGAENFCYGNGLSREKIAKLKEKLR